MATLNSKTATRITQDFAAAVQGSSSQNALARKLLDFTIGSILRAIGDAVTGVALWLQGLAFQVLQVSRLSTSQGADVDSWVKDFGLVRLPASPASGLVTFSRFTATNQIVIPVGTVVGTMDGAQTFAVYADSTNGAYSASAIAGGGYIMAASVASLNAPVRAVNPGTQGNVLANTIGRVRSGATGVDAVNNAAAFSNGLDAEPDAALKARFLLFIASLSKATEGAIGYAITSLAQGMQYAILEQQQLDGTYDPGFVTVIVDDGSGAPPAATITAAQAAVSAVRAAGTRIGVYPATTLLANVNMTLGYAPGYYAPDVIAQVVAALSVYINGIGLGNPLRYTRLEQIAYDASAGVVNVSAVTLNGGVADLIATPKRTIKVGSLVVS